MIVGFCSFGYRLWDPFEYLLIKESIGRGQERSFYTHSIVIEQESQLNSTNIKLQVDKDGKEWYDMNRNEIR